MSQLTSLLAFLTLVVTVLLAWCQPWRGRLRLFVAQSILLALLAVTISVLAARPWLLVAATAFAILKAVVVPRILARIAAGTPPRPVAPGRSTATGVLVAGALIVVAYVVMLPVTAGRALPTASAIPLGFAVALVGLFVCVTGRDVLGHVLGFLAFENGVFALALLATYGLPGLMEAGVLLDVLVIVLIVEGVAVQLRREHDSLAVDRLTELRG